MSSALHRTSFHPRPAADLPAASASAAAGETVLPMGGPEAERRRLEELLRKSEQKRQALLGTIAELVFVVTKDGTLIEFHAPPDNDFMLSSEGLVGKRLMELLPPQIGQQAIHYLERALRTSQAQAFSAQLKVPAGLRQFEARIAPYDGRQVIALIRDVTDRSYLEKEILEISNREQMRIGQDLHDGLGQHLTGITFLAKALERKLLTRNLPEAAEAGEINRLVMQALSQTRTLARGLFPVELESKGLQHACRELAAHIAEMFGVTCTVNWAEDIEVSDRLVALHLFRLAQEAISNAVRHGKARTIAITMQHEDDKLVFSIQDDGSGLSSDGAQAKGLGLRIMGYRAQKVGGTLDISPGAQGGTRVICTLGNARPFLVGNAAAFST